MAKGAPGARRRFVDLTLRFWDAYLERNGTDRNGPVVTGGGLTPRAIDHAAACVLARVDGKSPVEYLDPAGQELARRLALECSRPSTTWLRIEEMLGSAG